MADSPPSTSSQPKSKGTNRRSTVSERHSRIALLIDHSTIRGTEAREWLIRLDRDDPPSSPQKYRSTAQLGRPAVPAHRAEELLPHQSAFWDDANVLTELSIPLTAPQGEHKPRFSFSRLLGSHYSPLTASKRFHQPASLLLAAACLGPSHSRRPQARSPATATNGIFATAIGDSPTAASLSTAPCYKSTPTARCRSTTATAPAKYACCAAKPTLPS